MSELPGSGGPVFEEPRFSSDDATGAEVPDEDELDDEDLDELDGDEDLDDEDLDELDGDEDLDDEDLDELDGDEDLDDEDLDELDGGANRVVPRGGLPGGTARVVLEHIARSMVDDPDAVVVEVSPARSGTKLSLHVAPGDMGRVIGRRGRVAQALRTVVRAAAARDGTDASVDIVD